MTTQMTMEIQTEPGVWTDISDDVRYSGRVVITRGRSGEQSQAPPQRMAFILDNRTGRYSPRNPLSDLYGKIGRNTPVRCTIDNGAFIRFYGDISSWPPQWDPSHSDNFVPIEAYGILRRLGQGQASVQSAMRDFILGQTGSFLTSLAAYYPLSGGEETIYSQNLAPGKSGSFRGVPVPGPVFEYGKDMPAWIGTGMELNSTGETTYMLGTGGQSGPVTALDFVWQSSAFGVLTVQLTDYNGRSWWVVMNTPTDDATLTVSTQDTDGNNDTFTATGLIPEMQDRDLHHFRLLVATNGADTDYTVYIDGISVDSGTLVGDVVNGARECRFFYERYSPQTVMNMAHVTMWAGASAAVFPSVTAAAAAALAYTGETATARIFRVGIAGGVPIITVSNPAGPTIMGPIFSESRLDQIRDSETTDMGILHELRGSGAGLRYVSRAAMYNLTAKFTLDYAAGQVSPPLEPVDDDQYTRNDVTATRREGGSVRYTVDTGALSTLAPPVGVGRYDTEVTVNVETDGQLDAVASWVASIGTLDKARWPSVTVNLAAPGVTALLRSNIKLAEIGDRFVITGMERAFIYDDISLIIIGYTEVLDPFAHTITFNCMPAEPYEVFRIENTTSRIGSGDETTLTSAIDSTQTTMSLTSTAGTLWAANASGQLPVSVMIGGEEATITSIADAPGTSPQSVTSVTRSVNGVVKTHAAGEVVRLKRSALWAL